MAHPPNFSLQPLIPLPPSSRTSSSRPATPPSHPLNIVPDSPFSSLFHPPPEGSTSSVKPLFPVTIEQLPTARTTNNATRTDPTESPSSTFGEFVSSDPLQDSQLVPSFSPLEQSLLTAQRINSGNTPSHKDGEPEQGVSRLSPGTATGGLTFVQEAAARTKARADKVMGELLGRTAEDPLGWLTTEGSRDVQGAIEIFNPSSVPKSLSGSPAILTEKNVKGSTTSKFTPDLHDV